MWYNVDWKKLALLLSPTFLRNAKLVAFLDSMILRINIIHNEFLAKRKQDWEKLNTTGQVFSLRKMLNDKLDPGQRRITIGDGNSFPRKYMYTRLENKTVYGKQFIYQREEYEGIGADFFVYVPQEIIDQSNELLNYLIKYYKLASKRFKIEVI